MKVITPTYSAVAQGNQTNNSQCVIPPPSFASAFPSLVPNHRSGVPNVLVSPVVDTDVSSQFRGRRGSSSKRPRLEVDNNVKKPSQPSKNKPIVGTSNFSIVSGRKMRSPPADIFVWGVHPETTADDIANDLAASGINATKNDILKKSRDDAALHSYKISVPAADLQKALSSDI